MGTHAADIAGRFKGTLVETLGIRFTEATADRVATKGRASYLGERSIGHQDPGATSTALILRALELAVTAER